MSLWSTISGGLRGLFRKQQTDAELDDELRDYQQQEIAERMLRGSSRVEAERAAQSEVGGRGTVKEKVRAASWETHVENLWSDLRFGARLLRFNPLFAAAAILSLALGIGANAAIFNLLNAVQLRTLPVKHPENIARVAIDHRHGGSGSFSSRYPDLTYTLWQEIRTQQQSFSSMFAWGPNQFDLSPGGEARPAEGLWVSGEFFDTLGIAPAAGRLITTADDQPGCNSTGAVISYTFWQHEYGGDRGVLGRTLTVNRHPFPIIGVAAAGFSGVEVGRYFDVALPLCAEPIIDGEWAMLPRRDGWWLSVMGRLKPDWTVERASAQLRAASPVIFGAAIPPNFNPDTTKQFLAYKLGVFPADKGISDLREGYQNPLWLLLALAGLVLAIAAANLANLLLARASAREREMGVRMAIGASRARLIRQLLAESLLLALIGATLGAVLAHSLSQVLVASLSTRDNPLFVDLRTDWRVLGFTMALAVLTCVLFGLAPALKATGVSPGIVLKEAGRGTTEGRARFGLRRILVVSQVALSLTLLVGAVLFARSLNKLALVDAGFQRDGILYAYVDFTPLNLAKERRLPFANDLLSRIRAIPGVDAAAIAEIVPLSGNGIGHDVSMGPSSAFNDKDPSPAFNRVTPGFFATMKTPILAGRDFNDHDVAGAPLVAIVNETFAQKIAKNSNPVGMLFRIRRMSTITGPYEIVGLVKDTKYQDLREAPQEIAYTPTAQYDRPDTDAQILIRSNQPLSGLISGVKDVVSGAGGNLDVSFTPFRQMIDDSLLRDRLMARLSGYFGALAVILAVIGLYGVISYMVVRRRNEIGIRMSLGADRTSIIALVLREAMMLLAVGLVFGVVLALIAAKSAASMIFGLKPHDPVTLALAILVLAVTAFVASAIPALRASRVDPVEALRNL